MPLIELVKVQLHTSSQWLVGDIVTRCKTPIESRRLKSSNKAVQKSREDSVREHFDRIGASSRLYLLCALLCVFNIFGTRQVLPQ